jgi:hypothetical protein
MPIEEARALMADVRAVAAAAGIAKRRPRDEAALLLSELLNKSFSPETLRKAPVRYIVVGRDALYLDDDVIAYARRLIDEASPRRGSGRSESPHPLGAAPAGAWDGARKA